MPHKGDFVLEARPLQAWIGFDIFDRSAESWRRQVVGGWDVAYPEITIGGFTDCSVYLEGPSVEGVRVRFFSAGSHHRYLEVQSAPASNPLFASLGQMKRIDKWPFDIGDFTLRVVEVELTPTIKILVPGSEYFDRGIANLEPFGVAARPAIPRLLANLLAKDNNVRGKSIEALKNLGVALPGDRSSQIRSAILRTATDPDPAVRFQALEILAEMRDRKSLHERLSDSDPKVRIWAVVWLWRLTRRADGLVPVLAQSLREAIAREDEPIAILALGSLKIMGAAARPAVPAIALAIERNVYTAREVMRAVAPE
jgi:hypothetical protein